MSNKLFGRSGEIKILERLYHSNKPEFLAIYGRRRIGKTFLIHEFFKDKGIYFCVTGSAGSSKKIQLKKFYRDFQNKFPNSNTKAPEDWDDALYELKEAVLQIDSGKKVTIFFDEIPWLASKKSGFLPALEYAWNQYFSHMDNIIVIVCGSSAAWIIKKIIHNKRGLYGRLSEVIKLNAFSLEETEKFLLSQNVHLSRKQIVELYMSMGGIAKYLTYVHPGDSTAQTINRLCFTPQGQLVGEFNQLYASLFDHSQKHIQIVKGLSEKRSGIFQKNLLESMQISSGGQASSIIEELEESGFIAAYPEFNKKSKDKKLWLTDEYSYFYLTWIEQVKGSIILGNDVDYWLKMHNDPRWKTWSGYAFEGICLKHVAQIKKALGISAVLTKESQWSYRPKNEEEQGAQIDLIIDRKDECINLCEIRFYNAPFSISQEYAHDLRRKVEVFREQTKTTKALFLTLITPFGLNKNKYSIELVQKELTLEDLFN